MHTEGVTLEISDDAVEAIAAIAADVNVSVENIGARRLHTVMERLLDEISFSAARSQRRNRPHRRGLCAEARWRFGEKRRSVAVYSLNAKAVLQREGAEIGLRTRTDVRNDLGRGKRRKRAAFGERAPLRVAE